MEYVYGKRDIKSSLHEVIGHVDADVKSFKKTKTNKNDFKNNTVISTRFPMKKLKLKAFEN